MSHSGQGKTINGNRLHISGQGHIITGNFNKISGQGHVITGNYNTISGMGHAITGKENKISGMGHTVNGKSWSAKPSSSSSSPFNMTRTTNVDGIVTRTVVTNGGTIMTQTNVGGFVSNIFGALGGSLSVQNVNGIDNSFNFIGNDLIGSRDARIVQDRTSANTIDLTFGEKKLDPKTTKEGLYEYNGDCKVPSEDALTLDVKVSDDEDEDAEVACVICYERKRKCITRPCNHLKMCIACARTVGLQENPKCPDCRGVTESFELVYS